MHFNYNIFVVLFKNVLTIVFILKQRLERDEVDRAFAAAEKPPLIHDNYHCSEEGKS